MHNLLSCAVGSLLAATIVVGCSPSPLNTSHHAYAPNAGAPPAPPNGEASDDLPAPAADESLPNLSATSTLEDYLRYASLNNPGLESAFQHWKAALEMAPQVGALPDPRLTYGYYLNEIETRVGPMQHTVSVAQTFPWFGKLQDRRDAASRNANAAHQRFEAERLMSAFRVEEAYNELYFLKRSIDITSESISLLQQFERVARARYRVGAASHPDIVRIQVEIGKLEDRMAQLGDLRSPYAARLNATLNRAIEAPVPWPVSISERVWSGDASTLLAALRERNPELLALQEEAERERLHTEIARKDGLPDFTLGVGYTFVDDRDDVDLSENGDDPILATLSVNIPLWREKYEAGVRESLARRLAISNRRAEEANRLAASLQQSVFEHQDAQRRIGLFRDTLLPKSTESLHASLAGFEQGTTDFLDLLDTERTLLEFQLSLERALTDRATSYARMERVVGSRLIDIKTTPSPETPHVTH